MPILNAAGLSLVDIFFLLVILIGLPLETLVTLKSNRAKLASGAPGMRVNHYTQTIYLLWGISLPLLVFWALSDRPWAALGFTLQPGSLSFVGWGLAGIIAAFFLYQHLLVARSAKARQAYQDSLSRDPIMANYMPQTNDEYQVFKVMGITAGITEEIIFRGFLIWSFAWFMPVWAAALVALAIFAFLHLHQGVQNLPGILLMGGLMTLVFLLSGSIWPAIALHIFVDLINNATLWKARTLAPV